ncbi:MAG: NADH-quinone oxidoreductase subunit C [Planctomycetes bacterium]|nr:NADH-quinone oxidoreductase subunit C [Planctomycetota bacterium]
MTPEEIADILQTTFQDAVGVAEMGTSHPSVNVAADHWHDIAVFLRDDDRLRLNMLRCVSGVDLPDQSQIEIVYDLTSLRPPRIVGSYWTGDNEIAIRVKVPREGGHMPSVSDVWPSADWHEREVFDMLGVRFDGHPDLRRILCPDDWAGHPLRKDYEYPKEYHGIPGTPPSKPDPSGS